MTTPRLARLLGSTLATAAVAVGTLAGVTGTAQADVRDTDPVHIAVFPFGKADFGGDFEHHGGSPDRPGTLSWDLTGSTVTARLKGVVFWDDLGSGGCARARLRIYDRLGAQLGSTAVAEPVCPAGGGFAQGVRVTLERSSPHAHKAVIDTQEATAKVGPWSTVGSRTVYFGQPGGVD